MTHLGADCESIQQPTQTDNPPILLQIERVKLNAYQMKVNHEQREMEHKENVLVFEREKIELEKLILTAEKEKLELQQAAQEKENERQYDLKLIELQNQTNIN